MKNKIQSFQIILLALIIGPIMFGVFSFFSAEKIQFNLDNDLFEKIAPVIWSIAIALGIVAGKTLIKKAKNQAEEKRFGAYQSAQLVRFACFEAASILAITVFHTNGSWLFLLIALSSIGLAGVFFPGKRKILDDLDLSPSEIE